MVKRLQKTKGELTVHKRLHRKLRIKHANLGVPDG